MPLLVVVMNKSSMLSFILHKFKILCNRYIYIYIYNFTMIPRYLVSQGCIKPLCDLLVCPDPRIVTVSLEGLENILKVGEVEKNSGNSGDVNFYAQLIDDAEGLEKIENLQSHDNNEIYEKAVKILETYWLEEEEEPVADGAQTGFNFGGNNVQVPSGGFNFTG